MELEITMPQLIELKMIPITNPIDDLYDETLNMRNLPAHLEKLCSILGRDKVNEALATGEVINLRIIRPKYQAIRIP